MSVQNDRLALWDDVSTASDLIEGDLFTLRSNTALDLCLLDLTVIVCVCPESSSNR